MTFVGFDLHKRYITVCALSAEGEIIAEVRQLATSLEAILAWLALLPGPITVGVEATLYWEWLTTRLAARDIAVKVAHAFRVKLIWQARAKTDPIDARKLAELLRVNLLPAIWIPDAATRERRQLLRVRAFLVRERTQLKNRIHGHLTSENLSRRAPISTARADARGLPARRCRRCSAPRPRTCSRCMMPSPRKSPRSTGT